MPQATKPPATHASQPPTKRPPAETLRQLAARDEWLAEITPTSHFHLLFDGLPGLHFFAKNRQGRLMFLSRSIRERYGIEEDADVVGLTDFDINPHGMAASYVLDDKHIYETGEPLLGRVELWWDARGVPNWYVVTKLPVWSRRGKVIGVMGVIQDYEGRMQQEAPWREITEVVRQIRQRFRETLSIAGLARQAGLSLRQLQRKFQAALGVSPQEFLIKTRVLAACRALRERDDALAVIAVACGFYDQSSFTELFRRHVGQTPHQYRRLTTRRAM